jgi:hypothetical protein
LRDVLEQLLLNFVKKCMKVALILSFVCWLGVGGSYAQPTNGTPKEAPANLLAVDIWSPRDGAQYDAPATVHISTFVSLRGQGKEGDFVLVSFYANTNMSLGSKKSLWHGVIRPHVLPGQAMPMYMVAPGFWPADMVWSNVPAGRYTLMAVATFTNQFSAVSKPVNITVTP